MAWSLGGNGANTSYALGKLGVPVSLYSAVGADEFGSALRSKLQSAGVDVRLVGTMETATPGTVALVRVDGSRAFIHRPGASRLAGAQPLEFSAAFRNGATHFHLANVFALPAMRPHAAANLRAARAAGLTTSLDTGWDAKGEWLDVIGPCLPYTDVFLANEDEARILSGRDDPASAARFFRERGAGAAIVKLGARGCRLIADGFEFRAPAFDVPVADTTGAGDAFAAGFLAALHFGDSPREAARFANAVAALGVQALGGVAGLRDRAGTLDFLSKARELT
jgi:sugar/nucleoside kinase (ribokinase family)